MITKEKKLQTNLFRMVNNKSQMLNQLFYKHAVLVLKQSNDIKDHKHRFKWKTH